jgi:hypothetical protein
MASITCLNPVLNGSFGGYACGYKEELGGFDKKDSFIPETMKLMIIASNLTSPNYTMNQS